MKEIVQKLMEIEKETSQEKGGYDLFALFLREDSPNKWEILVAANWIDNMAEGLRYLAPKVQQSFTGNDFFYVSHIVIIDQNNPALPELQEEIDIEHGVAELKNFTFFDIPVRRAYIITSRKRQAA